jgi:acyl dehydratase
MIDAPVSSLATLLPKRSIALQSLQDWVGQEIGSSEWFKVDQHLIDRFAAVTGDDAWIHVDLDRAKRERGGTIAHGMLVLALFPILRRNIFEITEVGWGFNYGMDRLRYVRPVACGARIRLTMSLASAESRGAGLMLKYPCVMELEDSDAPAVVAQWITLLYPQPK